MNGEKVREINLSDAVFGVQGSSAAVHQVVVALRSNERLSTAHTKTRGEVRGGGRKPWRQKGTGRARHGSTRSPIWRKGGVVFGPLNVRNYKKEVPKSLKKAALRSVLSEKAANNLAVFVEAFPSVGKTKEIYSAFLKFKKGIPAFEKFNDKKTVWKANQALLLTSGYNPALVRSSRNLQVLKVEEARSVNVVDLLKYRVCVIEENAVPVLEKMAKK